MDGVNGEINDVSDTSLWVAHYRALETERPDALFRDPFAEKLVGERGRRIAERMSKFGRYTQWSVVSRTVMIDDFIRRLIDEGIDAVVNLGTGMDTRPYRMDLPSSLEWVEADFPNIIRHKAAILAAETPKCRLTRVEVDLSDDERRRRFLREVAPGAKKILVLTEGVIPYLSPEQVGKLADDLRARPEIAFWITEYFHKDVYVYLKSGVRRQAMRNAPFLFYPDDWLGFFAGHGWASREIAFSSDVAAKHGRRPPMPWWAGFLMIFMSRERKERARRMAGYMIFQRSP